MIAAIVWVVIVCIVAWFAFWVLAQVPVPEPIGKVARIVIIAIVLLVIIGLIASLFGVNTGLPGSMKPL